MNGDRKSFFYISFICQQYICINFCYDRNFYRNFFLMLKRYDYLRLETVILCTLYSNSKYFFTFHIIIYIKNIHNNRRGVVPAASSYDGVIILC